jgi:C4-dicarboxylate-specific signal transduction histidine kinase
MKENDGMSELEFFGTVTAAISHDINNRLAVINENAGLLEDYLYMYEKGRELDTGKLGRLAETVKNNVARANEIVKNLNRFAHSVDAADARIDLRDTVTLSTFLTSRTLEKQAVSLDVKTSDDPVTAGADQYHLLNLIWVCVDVAAGRSGPGGALKLTCGKRNDEPFISIRIVPATDPIGRPELPDYAEKLARQTGVSVEFNQADDTIVIHCRQ